MQYTVTIQRIEMIGPIWMPATVAAMSKDLSDYDMANIEDPKDRDSVAHWLSLNSGDFQYVTDFRADFHVNGEHIVHDWEDPDSECTYADCFDSED